MIIYDILEVQWCVQSLLQTAVTYCADFYSVPSQNVLTTLEYAGRIQTGLAQPMSRVPFIVGSWKGAWASKLEMLEGCGILNHRNTMKRDLHQNVAKGAVMHHHLFFDIASSLIIYSSLSLHTYFHLIL